MEVIPHTFEDLILRAEDHCFGIIHSSRGLVGLRGWQPAVFYLHSYFEGKTLERRMQSNVILMEYPF